jgi:anti-sigma factor RsiW
MIDEQLEFQIAQYADGTLPPAERAALEQLLARDAHARVLLNEYRRLDATLKSELPVPAMNWNRLAAHLSDAVAEEDRATTTLTIGWSIRSWGKVAAAAAILLVVGTIALLALRPQAPVTNVSVNTHPSPDNPTPPTAVAIVEIAGPAVQAASQPAVAQIDIGPSQWAKDTNYGVTDQVVYRESRVMIASGRIDRQDSGRLLPF